MISADAIRRFAKGKYPGVVRASLRSENLFPLRYPFTPINTTGTRDAILHAIATLRAESREQHPSGGGLTLTWETVNTTHHGRNPIPVRAEFSTPNDYLRYTGKEVELAQIHHIFQRLTAVFPTPAFADWLCKNWRRLCHDDAENHWAHVEKVLVWFRDNPFPGKYLREIPVDVSTKFIEDNLRLLETLIALVAPASYRATGETPEERLGFKTPETPVECRLLDDTVFPQWPSRNLSMRLDDLARLDTDDVNTVLITENRLNFLRLPPLPHTLALFGGGYAISRLRDVALLAHCRVLYWGDLDAHGFEILANLRRDFPAAESVMMDADTWERFSDFRVAGAPTRNTPEQFLPHLRDAEAALYRQLYAANQRLEQERILQAHAEATLRNLFGLNQ
jgi:hypothetical protein